MKIGVGYAAYITKPRHMEFARETLASIESANHELVACGWQNWSMAEEYRDELRAFGHLHVNDENNVSRAWNRSINCLLGQGCDYIFIPNLDIILKPGALDALVEGAQKRPDALIWTMANWHYKYDTPDGTEVAPGIANAPTHDHFVPHPHFSAFMVDRRLFERVGPFDENFRPAYNEDLDMHWRVRLAGETALQYEGARFYHYGSRTIGEDAALHEANMQTHQENNAYFIRKWGFKPATADDAFTDGMFRYPFNDPDRVGLERAFMQTWE